jgi:hypothetical protein
MKSNISDELKSEISDLKTRARSAGYKNAFPRFPKEQHTQKAFENLMMGFHKRLDNWRSGLLQLENPGGMLNGKKRGETDKKSEIIYFDGRIVSNDFADLAKIS